MEGEVDIQLGPSRNSKNVNLEVGTKLLVDCSKLVIILLVSFPDLFWKIEKSERGLGMRLV